MDGKERYEEEQTYTKVDRRVTREEVPTGEPPAPGPAKTPPQPEQAAPEAKQAAPEPEQAAPQPEQAAPQPEQGGRPPSLADLGVFAVLRFCVGLLIDQAWIALGIVAPPGQETRQNLPEARVAIDSLAALIAQLEPDLQPEEKREMDSVLANLRVNYVQRAG